MSKILPHLSLAVGVVVERRRAASSWADVLWRPVAVLAGLPEAAPWTELARNGETVSYYAGRAEIELYRSETANYRANLTSGAPFLWVALTPSGREPPYEIAAVTADPAEGEALSEPGQSIVDAVPMPESVQHAIAQFVAEHHVERPFEKRARDRADPESLARAPSSARERR